MRWCALGAAACILCSCSPSPDVERRSALDHGSALFENRGATGSTTNPFACATCHQRGDEANDRRILAGGVLAGAPSRPTYWGGQTADLLTAINSCRYYFMGATKAWSSEDEDAKAMYGFLSSLEPKRVEVQSFTIVAIASDLPVGDPNRGEDVFQRACRSCHGAAHTGDGRLAGKIPVLPEDSVEYFRTLGFDATNRRIVFIEKIRHGPFLGLYGTMPPFSTEAMSDEDLSALLGFLGL